MPYYEYHCQSCNMSFELRRDVAQRDDPGACPGCLGTLINRRLSLPATYSVSPDGSMVATGPSSSCGGCSATSCGSCGVKN